MDSKNIASKLRVYRKKSTFKGATDNDFWYSATRSDGASVKLIFKCPVATESKAFEISQVVGNLKRSTRTGGDVEYVNYTYYVDSCIFNEIEGVELPL